MDLIGRDEEIETVRDVVDRGLSGPAMLLLLGEAGAGKTSLLQVAAERARHAECLRLAAQGWVAEAELPFAALHQLLRPVLSSLEGLAGHLSEAVRTALGIATAPGVPDLASLRLAVATLLAGLAADRPVVLLIDDVHLVDRDSLEVLTFVLRHLTTERISAVLTGLGTVPSIPSLVLGPLADASAAELVDSLPGSPAGRARLDILRQSGGNPLALVELSRMMASDVTAVLPDRGLRGGQRVREMFADRLRALPERTQRLLVYAAAAEGVQVTTVMAAAGGGEDLSGWAPAERSGLVTITGDRITFPHPLARAAVYESAPAEVRAAVHRALAAALVDDPISRAAHLADAAVGPDESVAWDLENIAELALSRGGTFTAAQLLERAAECTPEPRERARRYARAIIEANNFGDPAWIRELYARVVLLTDDRDVLGVAAAGAGHALTLSSFQREAFDLLYDTLQNHRPAFSGITVCLTSLLTAAAAQSGLPQHRAVLGQLLAKLDCDVVGDPSGQLPVAAHPALRAEILAKSHPAAYAEKLIHATDGPLHQPLDGLAELIRLLCLGSVAWFADESDLCVTTFRQVFEQLGSRRSHGMAVMSVPAMAASMIATGQWEEAESLLDDARACAAVHGLRYIAADVHALQSEMEALRGRPDLNSVALHPVRQSVDLDENRVTHARMLRAAGVAALAAGDRHAAYRHLRELFAADGTPLDAFLSARSVADLAAAARLVGREADASAVVAAVRAQHPEQFTTRMRLLLHHADALLAEPNAEGDAGRSATVERSYELAISDPAGEQWPIERAQARLNYARWLRRRRRSLDARPIFDAALETFTRLGAAGFAEVTRAELRASGAAVAGLPDADPLDALTSQQREIVLLAARGLRNREIADQLLLSPRTVGSHLHNAYPRLGISGRHQLRDIDLGGH